MTKANVPTIDLSIIIPALNEATIIKDTLQQVGSYITKELSGIDVEVIVVAAQDKDNTAELVLATVKQFKKYRLVVISPKKRVGKGRDVALGFKQARGNVQLFTDADLAIPLQNIKKAYDLLIAQKNQGKEAAVFGIRSQKHNSRRRKIISSLGSLVTRMLFLTHVTDLQCGFKGFTAGAAKAGFKKLKTKGWAFDVEVFAKLQNSQISVIALPITKWHSDTHHLGGENLTKASVKSLLEMLRIRIQTFSLKTTARKLKITS